MIKREAVRRLAAATTIFALLCQPSAALAVSGVASTEVTDTVATGTVDSSLSTQTASYGAETSASILSTGAAETAADIAATVRFEETDPRFDINGTWVFGASTSCSGGAYAASTTVGATLSTCFYGTAVTVLGVTGPSYGKVEILIDGVSQGTRDLYGATYTYATPIYTKSGLSSGRHRVTVRVLGTKNASSSKVLVVLDAVDVTGTIQDANSPDSGILLVNAEDTDQRIVWHGLWSSSSSPSFSGGSTRTAAVTGSYVEIMFDGSGIAWTGTMSPSSGTAEVFLDGVSQGVVDLYSATPRYRQVLWCTDTLSDGPHRLLLRATGTRNSLSTASWISIDSFGTPEVRVPCYEQSDSRVTAVGTWSTLNDPTSSGGSYIWSTAAESHVVFRFNGTSMRWYGPVGPSSGLAEVYLDGRLVGTVDQYSTTAMSHQVVWSATGLKDGQHAVVIRVLNEKRAASTGTRIAFDAGDSTRGTFGTIAEWPTLSTAVEDVDARLSYTGSWTRRSSSACSAHNYTYSATAGASVSGVFTGSSLAIYGSVGPAYGKIRVYVDGTDRGVVDCYAPTNAHNTVLWSTSDLAAGNHTLTLVVMGAKSSASSACTVILDRFEAPTGRFLTIFDDRSSSIVRSAGWATGISTSVLKSTYLCSATAGARATLSFIGTSVALIASKGPAYGKAQVYIDGVSYGTVDLYSPTSLHQAVVFERSGLADVRHTVVLKVLGTKNAASSRATVLLDGFAVNGEPVTRRGLILSTLRAQLGKQYVWGGAGPNTFDCSGVTLYAYRSAGITLPHSSRIMWSMCSPQYLDWGSLLPADLVFTDDASYIHHVGVYVGYGLTINAPGTGKFVEYRAAETYGCYGRLASKYW